MFCPKCGKSDQAADSYCRSCGDFLIDPAQHTSLMNRILGITNPEKLCSSERETPRDEPVASVIARFDLL